MGFEFHAVDSGFQVLESGFILILDAGSMRLPKSLICIPDSKAQDSGLHKKTLPGFRNPDHLTWAIKIPEIFQSRS